MTLGTSYIMRESEMTLALGEELAEIKTHLVRCQNNVIDASHNQCTAV